MESEVIQNYTSKRNEQKKSWDKQFSERRPL